MASWYIPGDSWSKGLNRLTDLKEAVELADLLLSAINDMTSTHFQDFLVPSWSMISEVPSIASLLHTYLCRQLLS